MTDIEKEGIYITKKEVQWIMHELSIHFMTKECRDVLRFLTERVKETKEKATT